jgi:hypothetical protein
MRPLSNLPLALPGDQAAQLLGLKPLLDELKLSDDQKATVEKLRAELRSGDKAFRAKHESDPRNAMTRLIKERQSEVDAALVQAIGETAHKRLRQIQRQAAGLTTAVEPTSELGEALGITPQQKAKMPGLIQSGDMPRMPPPTGDVQQMMKAFREFRRKLDSVIAEKVLNEDQRKKWKEMIGTEVDFDLPLPAILPPPPARPAG